MKKISKKMLIALLSVTLFSACSETKITSYKNVSYDSGFDTSYAYLENTKKTEAEAKKNFIESSKLLKHYNELFDIYRSYSGIHNLKTINDQAGKKPVQVEQEIIDLLKEAKKMYDLSKGEFDVTMGATLKLWHQYREEGMALNQKKKRGNLPSKAELEATKSHRGWDKIQIDEEKKTVFITDPKVSLDVGGIAKGYASELVAKELEKRGVHSGYVNVGRNIRTIGSKPNNEAWSIGITDPEGKLPGGLLAYKKQGNFSFVTSGDYERYYIASDGKTYSHIIDPKTLFPANKYRSVTVLTADSGLADAMSTSLFTLSIEDGKKLIEKIKQESGQEINAVWVMNPDKVQDKNYTMVDQYAISYTDGLKDQLTFNQ
ncbi:FAD:protein FMN transferase [Bulleidia sp. zg-1006]|uniref:FAD:protein FMN transferase n=1 Tax=Bulleidia sp. zg-1006 TaxID=2806552 RepID=UPI00193AAA06|nr:FAD:protein FMN transferase [Bulleidia sp. zg-1006]QRG86313.1 FAD:protein FMN transferase [Bulleidia sp. zg-1006]